MERKFIAIVAGLGTYNDIGVIRSLGEKRIPVYYITNEIHVFPIHKSKYILQTLYCDMSELSFIDTIKSICVEKNAYGVVFPTSDITALYLDRNYSSLKDYCTFSHAFGQLEHEMDKLQMIKHAIEAGFNVPYSISADARNLHKPVKFPCIVKPLTSAFGEKSNITICHDVIELTSAAKKYIAKNQTNIIIQNLVTDVKQEIAITGISLPTGEVIIKGRVNKRCVMGNGSTVYGKYCIETHTELYCKIKNYIRHIGYIGIFDMEFLEDNSGLYHFIECNYRNGAYGYAVTAAGFNMPYIFYQAATGGFWTSHQKLHSVVFMEERSYILNLLQKKISLRHWIKNVLSTDVFMWFNWKDIRPYMRVPHFIKKIFVKQ